MLRRFNGPLATPAVLRLLPNHARIEFWNRMGCRLDPGCYIDPNVFIAGGTEVRIGPGTALAGPVELAAWGPISIGGNVMVSRATHVLTGSHDVDDPAFSGDVRPIVIEDHVWVAQGAVILPGVTLSEGAVVGAYAVVAADVPPWTVVAGNPARILRDRTKHEPTFVPAEFKIGRGRWSRR